MGVDYSHVPLAPYAERLRRLPPSCGPVRLVGIDGHAGSGKSTLAGRLARALGGAPVLHLDDLASHDALFDWTDRLRTQVVEPLSHGRAARYETYDWNTRRLDGARTLEPAEVILVEGVGAGRRAVRPFLASLLWMDLPDEAAWKRGRARDGEAQRDFWDGWIPAERKHFAQDPSRPFAEKLVRECPEGYAMREGPAGTTQTRQSVTHREGPPAVR
ncbi:uridine kinase [Streptomyces sp. PsTaAH-137]|uniref:uridine kinase family protein n=1 Tax=Streptomyces sp. PsTaAH-137 TaxID=1305830 RepID=UPI0035CEA791